jgi:hypothetical protein
MTTTKNILLITKEKAFYNSFRKVLGLLSNVNVGLASTESILRKCLGEGNIDIIFYKETTRSELYKWLWNNVRIANNSLLPFIVLGYREVDSINKDARDFVFEKKSENHQYIEAPFRLPDIFYSISDARPVNGNDLKGLIEKFGKPKGIIREILRHEIPNELCAGDKDKTIKLYHMARKLIVGYGVHEELISRIDGEIDRVGISDIDVNYQELSRNSRNISEELP